MAGLGTHGLRVIEPRGGLRFPDLRELWEHRDLLYFLIRRDVAIRYKQTAIGVAWAVIQPLLLALVFSVFFGLVAKVPSESGIPYPVFAMSGLVMWLYFSQAVIRSSASTVENSQLISKVYFPRIVIPVAAAIPPAIDFAIAFVVVLGIMCGYGFWPRVEMLAVPLVILLALTTALGLSLWFSALQVKYRDVALLVPFIMQVGLFITPIVYPFELVPDSVQWLYALNPMVGVLEVWRWMMFPVSDWPGLLLLVPVGMSAVLCVGGAIYFTRAERDFADVI